MKTVFHKGNSYVLRFDPVEEVLKKLMEFAEKESINGASFTAIGAVKKVVLAYYDIGEKEYLDKNFDEEMEIVNVIGNVARNAEMGNIIVHAHGSFGNRDFEVIGGHIKEMLVSATCEVSLTKLEGGLERTFNQEISLNLLK